MPALSAVRIHLYLRTGVISELSGQPGQHTCTERRQGSLTAWCSGKQSLVPGWGMEGARTPAGRPLLLCLNSHSRDLGSRDLSQCWLPNLELC
jgi:hypothetical protein